MGRNTSLLYSLAVSDMHRGPTTVDVTLDFRVSANKTPSKTHCDQKGGPLEGAVWLWPCGASVVGTLESQKRKEAPQIMRMISVLPVNLYQSTTYLKSSEASGRAVMSHFLPFHQGMLSIPPRRIKNIPMFSSW